MAAIVDQSGLELLFQALSRFDESNEEEAAGVNKALATVEHMAEVRVDGWVDGWGCGWMA